MNKLTSLALSALATNLLVGCVGDDLDAPEHPDPTVQPATPTPVLFPKTCAEIAKGNPRAHDGEHVLYVGDSDLLPWLAYCVDMQTAPKEYLTLPNGGAGTWSSYTAGGTSVGTDVDTRFDKVRIDPITLKLDMGDLTFAVSTGSLITVAGETVTSMPLGVAMSCGGGYATAQIDLGGTPFLIEDKFAVAGDPGATGSAGLWWTGQTIEMWADGACGWIAPELAPASPMNSAGGFVITLKVN